jgi:hypothetical protein
VTDFDRVEKFVVESFTKNDKPLSRIAHLQKTVFWLERIYPQANEALRIAAISHDIEAAFVGSTIEADLNNPDKLEKHQQASAEIIGEFLEKEGTDKALIGQVMSLVQRHEVGGTIEQNILKDADSLSFFDRDFPELISRHVSNGKDRLRAKFSWMYERISSPEAKELARPMYEKSMEILNNY